MSIFRIWENLYRPVKALGPCSITQSCPTLYDPLDCSPPDSSVHGIIQTRILEWVAVSFSRESCASPVIKLEVCFVTTESIRSEKNLMVINIMKQPLLDCSFF